MGVYPSKDIAASASQLLTVDSFHSEVLVSIALQAMNIFSADNKKPVLVTRRVLFGGP